MRVLIVLCACVALSACGTPLADIVTRCLPLPTYSLADSERLGTQIAALNPVENDMVLRALGDFHSMRSADLACQGVKEPQ